jgi:hypothetical protein
MYRMVKNAGTPNSSCDGVHLRPLVLAKLLVKQVERLRAFVFVFRVATRIQAVQR